MRRIDRSIAEHGGDRGVLLRELDEVLDRLVASKALNDDLYATSKVTRLVKHGSSRSQIRGKLGGMGVTAATVDEKLEAIREEGVDPELAAVCAHVRRRRLGPYRIEGERAAQRAKDLARLGRAGFSYGLATAALNLTVDEVEDRLLRG